MKFKPDDKKENPQRPEDDEDFDDLRLCPECEGRGFVYFKDKRDVEVWGTKELCLTCDGLGVVYE